MKSLLPQWLMSHAIYQSRSKVCLWPQFQTLRDSRKYPYPITGSIMNILTPPPPNVPWEISKLFTSPPLQNFWFLFRWRGAWVHAGWCVWDLGNTTIKKSKLQKSLKFCDCCKSIQQQIRPCCRKTFWPHFVFVWFRESNKI